MKQPRKIYFRKAADVPNSPLPVLLFRGVIPFSKGGKAAAFRKVFDRNGWTGIWTDTIYDYMHFHSNAHEVLGLAEGRATLRLGGEKGRVFRLRAGDMLVLPAGTGHKRLGDDADLKVIGAYPPGQSHYDMKRKGRSRPYAPLPPTDPFYGENGPLMQAWHR